VKHLNNNSVLMQYSLWFMYISDPVVKPPPNRCFLLMSWNITGCGGNDVERYGVLSL